MHVRGHASILSLGGAEAILRAISGTVNVGHPLPNRQMCGASPDHALLRLAL
ncbi:MAG: hypothetical protein ABI947_12775 [Chloroflexota bacterium]